MDCGCSICSSFTHILFFNGSENYCRYFKVFVFILVIDNFNIIYTIIFMFIFWCAVYLLHWTIIVVSKSVKILSHWFILGIFFLLKIRYNRVWGIIFTHVWNADLILSHPQFFIILWLLLSSICTNIDNNLQGLLLDKPVCEKYIDFKQL